MSRSGWKAAFAWVPIRWTTTTFSTVDAPSSASSGVLQLHHAAAPVAAVRGDQQLRLRVIHPVSQRLGAETAEDHVVRCADPRAGEHRDGSFGDHGQVDGDAVALLDPQALQDVGKLADFVVQVLISQRALIARLALPDQRRFVLRRSAQEAVEAVVRHVELPAQEPFGERRAPLQHPVPLPHPAQLAGPLRPEPLRVAARPLIHIITRCIRLAAKRLRGRKSAALLEQRLDGACLFFD